MTFGSDGSPGEGSEAGREDVGTVGSTADLLEGRLDLHHRPGRAQGLRQLARRRRFGTDEHLGVLAEDGRFQVIVGELGGAPHLEKDSEHLERLLARVDQPHADAGRNLTGGGATTAVVRRVGTALVRTDHAPTNATNPRVACRQRVGPLRQPIKSVFPWGGPVPCTGLVSVGFDGRFPHVDLVALPRRRCPELFFVRFVLAPHFADVGEEPRRRTAAADVPCGKATYPARRQPDALLKGVSGSVARPFDNLTVHGFSKRSAGLHLQLLSFLLQGWREGVVWVNFGCRPAKLSGGRCSNALTEPRRSTSANISSSLPPAPSSCMEADADSTRDFRRPI